MKKTNLHRPEETALFAFIPGDDVPPRQYIKQPEEVEPLQFEELGASMASIGEVFERMMSDTRLMTVEEHLGFPTFPDVDTLEPYEIERELFEILDLLADKNILIDTSADYPDEDLYRFITEELMQEEMEVFKIKDMNCHFIYEEFHQKEETAAIETITELFKILFSNDWRFLNSCLSDHFIVDGKPYTSASKRAFQFAMNNAYEGWIHEITEHVFQVLNHKKAVVSMDVRLTLKGSGAERKINDLRISLEEMNGQFKVVEINGLLPSGSQSIT